jgi:predicted secreted Zn-dependent protease
MPETKIVNILLLGLCFIFLSDVSPIFAEPIIKVRTEYYEVHGVTAKDIAKEMEQHRLQAEGFQDYYANTIGDISWRCGRSPIVTLDITFQMPKWVDYSKGSKELQDEWQRFEKSTKIHEEGHQRIAEEYARAVERRILAEGPMITGKLDTDLNDILADCSRKQIEYDNATDHGKTQGAFFNY